MYKNISFYITHRGYTPRMTSPEGYKLKYPVYTKFNVNMSRYSDQMFHRFIPETDLSLHGDDFNYLKDLSYACPGYVCITAVIEGYLGSYETKKFTGYIHRRKCTWDFVNNKVDLNIEWIDEYTNLLNNYDKEFDIIKLGIPSESISIRVQPIIQVYQTGATIVSNFIGGESFETSADPDIAESQLINNYKFAKILDTTSIGTNSETSKIKLKEMASNYGSSLSDQVDPTQPFSIQDEWLGTSIDNGFRIDNGFGFQIVGNVIFGKGTYKETVEEWLENASGYNKQLRWISDGVIVPKPDFDTGSEYEDIYEYGNNDALVLKHSIGIISFRDAQISRAEPVAYDYGENNLSNQSKPQVFVFDKITTNTQFIFASGTSGNTISKQNAATLVVKKGKSLFARLICYCPKNVDNLYTTPLDKSDPFNPNPKRYNHGIPYDASEFSTFNRAEFFTSKNFATDSDEGMQEYGCYIDSDTKEKRYYIPPFDYNDKNINPCWYPILRNLWGAESYWVRFGDTGADAYDNFWSDLPFQYDYTVKDAYRVDDIIRVLVGKINEVKSETDKEIKVAEWKKDIKDKHSSLDQITFSRFFERIDVEEEDGYYDKALYNQTYGRVPYFVPASNILAGDYETPAQTWKMSLKKMFDWLKDFFNVYFFVREINGVLYLEVENETFFKQGFCYERNSEMDKYGKILNLTNDAAENRVRYTRTQCKETHDIGGIPKRYEFSNSGNGGVIFSAFNVDMDVAGISRQNKELKDSLVNSIDNIKKISPEPYTDIDRITATPDEFNKGGTIMLMVQSWDKKVLPFCTAVKIGKNGKKWLSSVNYYASWARLSILHTHYTHQVDNVGLYILDKDWIGSFMIAPYIDLLNYEDVGGQEWSGEKITINSTSTVIAKDQRLNANPWRGLIPEATIKMELNYPVKINQQCGYLGVSKNVHDYFSTVRFYSDRGYIITAETDSAEINVFTGMTKFSVRGKNLM